MPSNFEIGSMQEQSYLINGPAGKLEVRLAQPSGWTAQQPVVVCAHPHPLHGGSMQNKVIHTVAKTFYSMQLAVVRFNFRGVGQSQGVHAQAEGECDDLLAVVDWLRNSVGASTCWLAGFSFGAYIALRTWQQAQARFLLTIAPAIHMYDATKIQQPTIPWVYIQGNDDEIVPPATIRQWLAQLTTPPQQIWLDDVGHFFHGKLNVLQDKLLQATQASGLIV